MGGEKLHLLISFLSILGSPPRGRGKVWPFHLLPAVHRITPAWAGKRQKPESTPVLTTDHPRVGGEKQTRNGTAHGKPGSPPRGRGKASFSGNSRLGVGITPAWAGKSLSRYLAAAAGRDHPRVGGEKIRAATNHSSTLGSPPRGRGKAAFADFIFEYSRITPAWAGKSLAFSSSASRS